MFHGVSFCLFNTSFLWLYPSPKGLSVFQIQMYTKIFVWDASWDEKLKCQFTFFFYRQTMLSVPQKWCDSDRFGGVTQTTLAV